MTQTPPPNQDDIVYVKTTSLSDDGNLTKSSVWLVSFTDVIALMLTFFVLLYSMSTPDSQKWEYKVGVPIDPVAEYSGPSQNAGVNEGQNINRIEYNNADDREYVEALLKEILNTSGAANDFIIRQIEADVELTLSQRIFDKASSLINKDSGSVIGQLSPVLNNLDNQIKITASLNAGDKSKVFERMQMVGALMKQSGYKKPIALGLNGGYANDRAGRIHILIQPHDGRRIIR
jgi:chemotaxis protein MotB